MSAGVSVIKMLDQRGGNRGDVQRPTHLNKFVGSVSLVITPLNSLTITISELICFAT